MDEANKLKAVYFRTKHKVQYHAGYHEELAKRYSRFGKVRNKGECSMAKAAGFNV